MADPFANLNNSHADLTGKQPNPMANRTSVDVVVHIPLNDDDAGGTSLNGFNTSNNERKEEPDSENGSRTSSKASVKKEDEVARFKREREERIRGLKLAQTIKEEEEARILAEAEIARRHAAEQARRKAEEEAARQRAKEEALKIPDGGTLNDKIGNDLVGDNNFNLISESLLQVEPTGSQGEEEEKVAAQAETEAVRLQKEEEEKIAAQAEAEAARLQKEEEERVAAQAEAEAARLQKEEEEKAAAQAQAEAEALKLQKAEEARITAEAQAHKFQKEEEERMRKQAEAARLQKLSMEYQRKKEMEDRVAAQTEAARRQKENEDYAKELAQRAKARRPLSATLQKFRDRHEKKEGELKSILSGVSYSASGDSEISFADTDSLVSHNRNLARGVSLKWERLYLNFCFGLLTTRDEAPKTGPYEAFETVENVSMLQNIMSKVSSSSKNVLEENSGNVIMKSQHAFVTHVKRDDSFEDHDRPGLVRSFVKATIPLSLTDIHEEITNTSKIVAKVMIRQALIDEVAMGNLVPDSKS